MPRQEFYRLCHRCKRSCLCLVYVFFETSIALSFVSVLCSFLVVGARIHRPALIRYLPTQTTLSRHSLFFFLLFRRTLITVAVSSLNILTGFSPLVAETICAQRFNLSTGNCSSRDAIYQCSMRTAECSGTPLGPMCINSNVTAADMVFVCNNSKETSAVFP